MTQPALERDAVDQLNATRAGLNAVSDALSSLDAEEDAERLREVTAQVGNTLIETATSDVLWAVLSRRSERTLNRDELARLRAAVSIDWVGMLNALGYQPPPPADTYGKSYVEALSTVIVDRDGRDIDEVRAKVRELGTQLVALTALPATPRSRFRKWLRRGARVVRGLAVASGVAAAAVVIGHAVMPAAAVTAIAAATAPLIPGHVIGTAVIVEVVNEVTKKSIEFILDAALGRDPDAASDDEDSETTAQRARQRLGAVSVPQIRTLADDWAAVGRAEHAKPPVAVSRQFIGVATMSVHLAAVAAAGADWATTGLCDSLNAILALVGAIDDALQEKALHTADISAVFTTLADRVEAAQTRLNSEAC
jgi:hypothetical protein